MNGSRLGDLEVVLVRNFDGEALGRSDGVMIARSEKGCRSVYQMGTGLENVWVGCLVGLEEG